MPDPDAEQPTCSYVRRTSALVERLNTAPNAIGARPARRARICRIKAGGPLYLSVHRFTLHSEAASLQDATSLALGTPSPHTMFDAKGQGVLEACVGRRAVDAHLLGYLDSNPITGEEKIGSLACAITFCHPRRVHELSPSTSLTRPITPQGRESERKCEISVDFRAQIVAIAAILMAETSRFLCC